MAMERINEAILRKLQSEYVFQSCGIKGTDVVNTCKNMSTRFGMTDIDEFLVTSKKRRPAVYRGERTFLRITKR